MTMLDHMLEVMYKQAQQTSIRNQMADGLKNLPVSELKKLASGEMKLAFHDDDDWLCKFKGTPMYDEALQLETECLELDAQQQQMSLAENEERRARSNERDAIWDQKDAIRLKKRLLELDLRKAELAAAGGGEEFEEPEEELEEDEPEEEFEEEDEKEAVASYFVGKQLETMMGKFAGSLKRLERVGKAVGKLESKGAQKIHDSPELMSKWKNLRKAYNTAGNKTDYRLSHGGNVEGLAGKVKNSSASVEALAQRFEQAIQKTAAAAPNDAMQVADLWGRQMAYMDKQAGLGQVAQTAWQGLKGAGKFVGEAAKGTAGVVKGGGGVQGAMTGLGLSGQAGLQRAGNFIKQNPGAAAMLAGGGAAAAGAGGLAAGGAIGRATAPRN